MSKHTPGPWKVKIGGGAIEITHRIGAVTEVVATVHGHDHLPVIVADAALIAAAPQLLDCVKALIQAYEKSLQREKMDVAVREAKIVLEQIEGES